MFTIRFELHNLQAIDYEVHQCDHYRVLANDNRNKAIWMYEDGATPATMMDVGFDSPYKVAYVTNERGHTIDTIRCYEQEESPKRPPPNSHLGPVSTEKVTHRS